MLEHYIIAIDGPAGSGKSTTAVGVAKRLGLVHLDTGAMYRAFTLAALEKRIPVKDVDRLKALSKTVKIRFKREKNKPQRIFLNGIDVTRRIRGEKVTNAVSAYCAIAAVRESMVKKQRHAAKNASIVLEGRDIGTVVFPGADFKFYLTASVKERAKRRLLDLRKMGEKETQKKVMADIKERDRKDSTRAISPLKKAADAITVDTTNMTIEEQIEYIINIIKPKLNPA